MQILLFRAQGVFGPSPERLARIVLDPELQGRFEESATGLEVLKGLYPGVETSGN